MPLPKTKPKPPNPLKKPGKKKQGPVNPMPKPKKIK